MARPVSSSRFVHRAAALVAGLGLAVVAGCGGGGVTNKTGSTVLVLKFATFDVENANGQNPGPGVFIEALEHLSGGRIKVRLTLHYEDGTIAAETNIVKSIVAGTLDGGWPATRAFARAGILGLEPVEAPLTLTSYAAQKALATGPAGAALLNTLKGSGVVGLGLTVGPLRQPWSQSKPLVDVASWHGVTFRSLNSPVEDATIRALGGVPVEASYNFPDLVQAGELKAVETDVAQYTINDYGTLLPRPVANEVLWPKMDVLAVSQKRFDSLTATQQGWVRQAAEQAVQASVNYRYDETPLARQLCAQGVRFAYARPAQLVQLRRAVHPVIAMLAADPATAASLAWVEKVAARYPRAEAINVPTSCRTPRPRSHRVKSLSPRAK